MQTYIIIAVTAILFIIAVLGLILFIRARKFKPNPDKYEQQKELNKDLSTAGFAYEPNGDYFCSNMDCWQREAGYCALYDEGAPLFNMITDCEPITFDYGGKHWLIELWKGQYGITTGAEIGVYNTVYGDIKSDRFTGTFYEAADDSEMLDLSFVLYKNGKKLISRRARHWWLTAFKLGEFSEKSNLTMSVKIRFTTREMRKAFTDALIKTGYRPYEFSTNGKSVSFIYTSPRTKQPITEKGIQENAVQLVNKNNCEIYNTVTAKYSNTLDKLEYLKFLMPELYSFMLNSLYAKGFFGAFEWIIDLLPDHNTPKPPKPPEPPYCRPCVPCDSCCEICRNRCGKSGDGK